MHTGGISKYKHVHGMHEQHVLLTSSGHYGIKL